MKKLLAVILAVVMLALLVAVIFPASADTQNEIGDVAVGYKPAASATKISTAAEFAAMSANGNYYLANDIDLSSLETPYYNGCFKGTLDGCGYTIKLAGYSAFRSTTAATLKNMKTSGEVNTPVVGVTILGDPGNDFSLGGFSQMTGGGTFENLLNTANISYAGTEEFPAAGIFGRNFAGDAVVKNCKNTGSVTVPGQAAGIVSWATADTASDVKFIGCVNSGRIESTTSYAGGIVARGRAKNTFEKCVNTGAVIAKKDQAAGIVAYHWANTANCPVTITECSNSGEMTISNLGYRSAGGIFGYISSGPSTVTVEKCFNSGKITSATTEYTHLGGIVGSDGRKTGEGGLNIRYCVNTADISAAKSDAGGIGGDLSPNKLVFEYNVNTGKIEAEKAFSMFHVKSGDTLSLTSKENYHLDGVAADAAGFTANLVSAEQLASGEVTYKLNTANGSIVFYQNIGTDATPVLDKTHDTVIFSDNKYSNVPTTTEPPVTTTEPTVETTTEPIATTTEPIVTTTDPIVTTTEPTDAPTETNAPTDSAEPTDDSNSGDDTQSGGCMGFSVYSIVLALAAGAAVVVIKRKKQ